MMNIQNIVAGALAVAVIGGIGFKALSVIENNNSYITVKGVSDRNVIADCAMWKITVVTEANTIKEAQEKMKKDMDIVTQFLKTEGISDTEIIDTYSKTHDKFYYGGDNENTRAKRFDLKGKIKIRTNDIKKVRAIKLKFPQLQEQGINVNDEVKYVYTKIDQLRIEMLQEAAKDSENRAQKIAETFDAKIVGLRNFVSGKFSISAEDATITSDNEWCEEYSLNKRLRVVVTSTFNLQTR